MNCGVIALAIIFSVIYAIDYTDYRNGSNSWFFRDKTEIEKINREIQLLEAKAKLKGLKSALDEGSDF